MKTTTRQNNNSKKNKHQMKRAQATTIIKQTKRQRLFLQYLTGPLIEPFLKEYPNLQPPFPSINDQNVLFDQFSNLRLIPEINDMIVSNNTPFVTIQCVACNEDKLLHEFSIFSDVKANKRRTKNIPTTCSSCGSIAINKKKRTEYTEEEKEDTLSKLKNLILKAHRDNSDLNAAHMYKKCKFLVESGVKEAIDIIFEKGAEATYHCKSCKENKYLYDFRTDVKCKDARRKMCTSCSVKGSTEVRVIAGMKVRNSDEEVCVQRVYEEKMEKQNKCCFLSLVPFATEYGHPFKASPERTNRSDRDYSTDNVVLILNLLNVGGRRNFDRRLILQSTVSLKLDIVFQKYKWKSIRKFLKSALRSAKNRADNRAENEMRVDNSSVFTLTYIQILDMVEAQEYRCALSKVPLVPRWGHPWSLSIDRKNDREGYTEENVRLVVARYNPSKTWNNELASTFFTHIEENKDKLLQLYNQENDFDFQSCEDPLLIKHLTEDL